jgi:hypothetical protein
MTFPRRAQRQALHGTAVGVSERRRPARVGVQLVSTYQQVPFGAAAAVSAMDFMGGRSGSSHVRHVGRHRAAHRAGILGNPWWTLAGVSIGAVMVGLGGMTGLHTTMTAAAAAAGVGAVLALVVRHVGNAGTVVPTLPARKPDALLAEPAERDGFVGARSSRHGAGQ